MQVAISKVRSGNNTKPRLAIVAYIENDKEERAAREFVQGKRRHLVLGPNDKVASAVEAIEGVVEV
ncbi:MAG: hypothetical protein A3A97_00765 [Candidatus Terrybacteria bacterium RIFCSPLOWO2_01_FULL_40_23]|uniref:Uncharacterized protein n=1 Tax=Candidatus Terrybacteria bacterium RIFCSPLOWO2_01_FULL_40_23 TaxID=1802366 RepID=A0A1G2PUW1_9BACT|nr:MAG: hypothetical protein A3A97_00765 [Candidatus Terrybacteria bacterium RIFCSPLOWO2_01_FULL_40_23]